MEYGRPRAGSSDNLTNFPMSATLLLGRTTMQRRQVSRNECRSLTSFVFPSSPRSLGSRLRLAHIGAPRDSRLRLTDIGARSKTKHNTLLCALIKYHRMNQDVRFATSLACGQSKCPRSTSRRDPNYTASTKPRAPIPTVPGAVGDNSTQIAKIDSTTTSMSRKFDAMIEERILQTVTFLATV